MEDVYIILVSCLSDLGFVYIYLVDYSLMGILEVLDSFKKKLKESFKNIFIFSGGYDLECVENDL